jgi:hypothetical protein
MSIFPVPLSHCVFVLKIFALSADDSPMSAMAVSQMARGGIDRTIRCIGVISAEAAVPAAIQKYRFSGLLPASRLPLRREIVTNDI